MVPILDWASKPINVDYVVYVHGLSERTETVRALSRPGDYIGTDTDYIQMRSRDSITRVLGQHGTNSTHP